MNTLFIDNSIWGELAANFALAKSSHIRELSIETEGCPLPDSPMPVFIHSPTEFVYGFWRTIEYIDAKFGPERPLIPSTTPHERANVLSFCQYQLERKVVTPLARINSDRAMPDDTANLQSTITALIHNLGYKSFVYENKLTVIDVFLATFYQHLVRVYPQGMPIIYQRYKEYVDEQLTLRRSSPELFWDLPCDDDDESDLGSEHDAPEGHVV